MNGSAPRPELGDQERRLVAHQAADEVHVAREPVELGDHDRRALAERLGLRRARRSCGRRSSASLPLPVSTSVSSAATSKPSASAKRRTAARWLSKPKPERPCRASRPDNRRPAAWTRKFLVSAGDMRCCKRRVDGFRACLAATTTSASFAMTKISAIPEDWDMTMLREYGKLCAWALARAHARSGDAAKIAGYMGSNTTFDDAVCEFAVEYADQNLRDYRRFVKGGATLSRAPRPCHRSLAVRHRGQENGAPRRPAGHWPVSAAIGSGRSVVTSIVPDFPGYPDSLWD